MGGTPYYLWNRSSSQETKSKLKEVEREKSVLAVVGVLGWLFLTRGIPKFLRSDNGPEFIARAVCQWLRESGCQTLFITPRSPRENGYIESFFDKLRDECLNREVFRNGREAQAMNEYIYLIEAG